MLDSLLLMRPRATARNILQFGPFELDTGAGELRKNGFKLKLQDQPLKILKILLQKRGDIVTREELRENIWPANTFVEFDHGLYSAMARLRDVLGDSAESPRFVETLARRGYRFIAPVTIPESMQASNTTAPETTPPSGRRVSKILAYSLAVLPFENLSGNPAEEYFADGMTDEVITRLAQLGSLRVISRTSMMQYKGGKKPLPQIGRELNVDTIVEGSVMRSQNRVRITAQLVDTSTDHHVWAHSYERERGDVFVVQNEISRAIAAQIRASLTPEQQAQLSETMRVDPDTYDLYLQGMSHLERGDEPEIRKAVGYFEQAIARDPRSARSYAALAQCYLALTDFYEPPIETMAKAKRFALESVELDKSLPEGHAALGAVDFLYDWDWPAAEKEFREAIRLTPGSADAHGWYGLLLAQTGRFTDGISEIKQAEALDPLSVSVHINAGWVYYVARQNESALQEWRKVLDLEPAAPIAHTSIWMAYVEKSEFREALAESAKAGNYRDSPLNLATLAGVYAASGKTAAAQQVLARLTELAKHRYVCPYEMATAHAGLGNHDEAIRWLEKGVQVRSVCMPDLKTDPRLDPLRSDARFQKIARTVGLP